MKTYLNSVDQVNSGITRLRSVVELLSGFSDKLQLNTADLSMLLGQINDYMEEGLHGITNISLRKAS